jgi:HSP20 family protein
MLSLWNGFDRVFDDELRRMNRLVTRDAQPRFGRESYPRVNVLETDGALVVSAEVPGFAPNNVEVTVHDGVLAIEGKVDEAKTQEEGKVLYSERRNVSFKRTFTLNTDVDVERVTAVVKDGLLSVTLPKVAAAKPRQIAVASAD